MKIRQQFDKKEQKLYFKVEKEKKMIHYFEKLLKKDEKTNFFNVEIKYVKDDEYENLLKILKDYPGCAVSKESKSQDGAYLPRGTRGIIFKNDNLRKDFMKKYASQFEAKEINTYLPTKIKAF
jgi:hypothetical protein